MIRSLIIAAVLGVAFFIFGFFAYPLERKFQVSVDEGFNLQRSGLVNQGYSLYSEIASDQPPLFTMLLARVLASSNNSPVAARLLVLVFSAIAVGCVGAIVGLTTGNRSIWLVAPLFFILPWYMHLSTAIMIGLPSIGLATASVLALIIWIEKRSTAALASSAVLITLSLFIKFFTAFLAPVLFGFIGYVTVREQGFSYRNLKYWVPLILWSVIFAVLTIALALTFYGWENILENLRSHFGSGTRSAFDSEEFGLWEQIKNSWLFFILAVPGFYFIVKQKLILAYPLVVWILSAIVALSLYTPVWAHHQLLITVPLVGIQAIGIQKAFLVVKTALRQRELNTKFAFSAAGLALMIGMLAFYAPAQIAKLDFDGIPTNTISVDHLILTEDESLLLNEMRKYSPATNWVVTDMPYYAFAIGVKVPPNLATFSTKMINSGAITSYQVLKVIEDVKPEQVLLGRITIKQVNNYLKENYINVADTETGQLYIRPDIYHQK